MQPDQQTDQILHKKLPIDADEKVLAIYKHHWFAYFYSWAITVMVVIGIFALAWLLTSADGTLGQYRGVVLAAVAFFGLLVLIGGTIPAYLRSQEQLVLTDESLLKLLKPTIFSHKVDQLGLQHVADVSVHQDVIGTMLGFGTINIETAGEQRTNYDFIMVPNPTKVAQQINEQKEEFDAALQGGRIESNMPNQMPKAPQIDPQEFQEFLQFEQMKRSQQGQSPAGSQSGTGGTPQQPTSNGQGYQNPSQPQSDQSQSDQDSSQNYGQ